MSETECRVVKLREVDMTGGVDEAIQRILNKEGWELYDNDYRETLRDFGYDKYVLVDEVIYEVIEDMDREPYDDVFEANRRTDGAIGFVVQYYNGGCSFSEAIENALKKLNQSPA
ncbi:MAG: hypothetical protein N0E44_18280 [Candidatus Thiodiazotropha lotti]|nr:hypothetical protein [Candidatus Thiodiazotropha lotti]MCW4221832.1 hypothetical protein [Candidatus Thiodiazotropha lotti]